MLQKLKQILNYKISNKKINYKLIKPWGWNWLKIKEALKICFLTLSVVALFIIIFYLVTEDTDTMNDEQAQTITENIISYLDSNYFTPEQNPENCNVKGVELHGGLFTYVGNESLNDQGENATDIVASEQITYYINQAEKDSKIKAIILEVDSSGGSVVAAEEVANALKKTKKPTVALIRERGLSAAYWASTGANIIFASAVSDVGSIGVTYSYLDNAAKNSKEGLNFNSLSTGKFKDTGSLDKPLTAEERNLIMQDLNIANDNFIKAIATNRNIDINKVRAMADGSSMLGREAIENKLVDKIGGIFEVKDYLKEKIGKDVEICW